VSALPVAVTPLATYRNERPYPFCPGCGHASILDRLNEALVALALDPRRVVLVSDIGCSGLSDQYFATGAFHGLHGRSLTYATGLKLARPELAVVVLLGDGGTGIGGAHLLAASRRNLDLTVVVFNNFNYGMTGGQHSGTTPGGALTSTTPDGNLERPLDLCATAVAAGATFAHRGTSFDVDLASSLADAIRHPGFALVDVWEPCTAYFAPRNRLTRKAVSELMDELGFAAGRIREVEAPEYGAAAREAAAGATSGSLDPQPVEARFRSQLDRPFGLVLAGAAGGRVGTAARLLARAGLLSSLWAAQRADYPVTVKTGFSAAEVVLSPLSIDDAAIEAPDAVLALAPEGRAQAVGAIRRLAPGGRVFTTPELVELADGAEPLDVARASTRVARDLAAVARTVAAALALRLVPVEALEAAADGDAALLGAVAAGRELAATA